MSSKVMLKMAEVHENTSFANADSSDITKSTSSGSKNGKNRGGPMKTLIVVVWLPNKKVLLESRSMGNLMLNK